MAETKKKTVVKGEFIWPEPDINVLKAAVAGPIRSFLPDLTFYATTTIT